MDGAWLTKPSLRLLLIALGGVAGAIAFVHLPIALVGAISKTASVFVGTVWVTVMAFALKVSDITEAPGLSPGEHEHLELKARHAVRRVWLYAALNAVAAVFILIPSVMADAKAELAAWAVVSAGAAIGFSIHSILVHSWWQEELRRFRSTLRERERIDQFNAKLASKVADNPQAPISDADRAEIAKLNTKIDWPAPPVAH